MTPAGMALLPLGKIAVLQFVYPLTAVLVDWCVYGRTLNAVQLLGVALMAFALWTTQLQVAGAIEHGNEGNAGLTLVISLILTFLFLKDGRRFLPWLHRLAVNVILARRETLGTRRKRYIEGDAMLEIAGA